MASFSFLSDLQQNPSSAAMPATSTYWDKLSGPQFQNGPGPMVPQLENTKQVLQGSQSFQNNQPPGIQGFPPVSAAPPRDYIAQQQSPSSYLSNSSAPSRDNSPPTFSRDHVAPYSQHPRQQQPDANTENMYLKQQLSRVVQYSQQLEQSHQQLKASVQNPPKTTAEILVMILIVLFIAVIVTLLVFCRKWLANKP
jgi:hypothetical protein